jgi:PAS domain S-box-containing protein
MIGESFQPTGTAMPLTRRPEASDRPYPLDDQLRAVLAAMPAMVWLADPDGGAAYLSQQWLDYTGLTEDQALGWRWFVRVHQDDLARLTEYWRSRLASGAPGEVEARLLRTDGQHRWCVFRAAPLRDASGRITGWCGSTVDNDDQYRARQASATEERDLRLILDTIPALVSTATPAGDIDFANGRMLDYFGLTLQQLLAWRPVVHPDDLPAVEALWKRSVATGEPFIKEYRIRRADGVYRWFHSHVVAARGIDGAIDRWYNLLTDVTDRKHAEDLLRASELELRTIVDNIPGLVAILAPSGEIEMVNRGVLDYFGRTLEELQEWRMSDSVHPEDLPSVVARWRHAIETGEPPEWEERLRRADGVYRWFQLRGFPWRDGAQGPERWYCLITDIHDRKMAEEALRRSETFLLEVQRLSHTGGWRFDLTTGAVESSPEVQRAHAVQPGEDPTTPAFWFDRIHPDDRPRVEAEFARCLHEKTAYRAEFRNVLPDGRITYQYTTGHPTLNHAGEVVEVIGASMDMTEHWLATTELARASQSVRDLQMKMSHAARIASVGELAGSIAHEVNQPLAAVVANGHACLRWLSAAPPNLAKAIEAAERIVKDGKDAGEVVRRVRSLFKRTAIEKVSLDPNEVLLEVMRLLDSYPARQHVAIETMLDADVPRIRADRVQLQQLVLNLVLNGLEAVEPVSGREKRLTIRSSCVDNAHVVVAISDNGIGLDNPEVAFEPFITTKPEGMGLGLAICRSIVAEHGGQLSAHGNVGFGTTLTVTLPIHSDVAS